MESESSGIIDRADFRFAPSQWETLLQSNAVSHWLGTNLESALIDIPMRFSPGHVTSHERYGVSNHQHVDCVFNNLFTVIK